MNKQCMSFKIKVLAVSALVVGVQAGYADGYRNPPPTAEGIAKSGANTVFVDDASAISYNPANLALQTNISIVVGTTFAKTENSYYNPLNPAGTVDSKDSWAMLPNLYAAVPIGESGVTLGLGLTTPYGQGIEWNPTDVYNPFAPVSLYQAEIKLITITPSVAFRVGEKLSIGAGADIYYSELAFDALTGPGFTPTGAATAEGEDTAVGGNVGVTWQVTERQRAVFTYKSETTLKYDGDLSVSPGAPLVSSSFSTETVFPNILAAGYGIELTDDIRIEANLEWLEWSSTQTQSVDLGVNGTLQIPQNWDNTFTFGVGGDWQFAENWIFRSGYAFIESPIPDSTIAPTLPDADRHVLSFGLGYALGGHALDLAYSFSFYDDRSTPIGESYEIDSDLVGLTYSYSF